MPEREDAAYLARCFAGRAIYGDDFDRDQRARWLAIEKEAYAGLVGEGRYAYGYHALNERHGFRHLPDGRFEQVLGMGAALGDELLPLAGRMGTVTILESSDALAARATAPGLRYVKPSPDGLPFADQSFDLVTCLGVLHHLPHVSHSLAEMYRILRPGGHALVREPTISMGDWRQPRRGLTPMERGIPLELLLDRVGAAGFEVRRAPRVMFSLTSRLAWVLRGPIYNRPWVVTLDRALSLLFSFQRVYHDRPWWVKVRPTAVYLVLRRPPAAAPVA